MDREFKVPRCQHCDAILYDGTYKKVNEDGSLSRETFCSNCHELLWTTKDPNLISLEEFGS